MEKLVPFNTKYEFVFLEEREHNSSPVSEYYLMPHDMSINLLINLKWIYWGYFFLDSLSKQIETVPLNELIDESINSDVREIEKRDHILLIDDDVVKNREDLEKLIVGVYSSRIFTANAKIHMKLKVNLNEFLDISHNVHPALIKFTTKIEYNG